MLRNGGEKGFEKEDLLHKGPKRGDGPPKPHKPNPCEAERNNHPSGIPVRNYIYCLYILLAPCAGLSGFQMRSVFIFISDTALLWTWSAFIFQASAEQPHIDWAICGNIWTTRYTRMITQPSLSSKQQQ